MSNRNASELLLDDLRSALRHADIKGYHHPTATSLDLSDLLIAFMNWRVRHISPRPRQVHVSVAMEAQPEVAKHQEALVKICQMLEKGTDVAAYHSKRANSITLHRIEDSPKRRKKRRDDLDAMLSDWGVYHLHLGTEEDPKKPDYAARGDDLLFLLVGPSDALLIGIFKHGEWAKEDVARIIVNEWCEHSKFKELQSGVTPVEEIPSNSWQGLRDSGISPLLTIDDRHYWTGDMTLASTSIAINDEVFLMIQRLNLIDELARLWEKASNLEPLYRREKMDGWYGLSGPTGFHHAVTFPWWYDGENWTPDP